MTLLRLDTLTIAPDRQRRPESPSMAPEAIGQLADSIESRGLLQPLIVEGTILRAGERRSKAIALLYAQGIMVKHGDDLLPFGMVPVVSFKSLTPLEAFLVELEENEKREPLTWQEKAKSYATLRSLLPPTKTTAEAVRETLALATRTPLENLDTSTGGPLHATHQTIIVGNHLSDPDVARAKSEKEAIKIIDRKRREAEDAKVTTSTPRLFAGDCRLIMAEWPAAHFDCVVTDPPYGVDITQLSYQNSSEHEYDDTYENWVSLLPAVFDQYARLLKPDAHGYAFCAFERFAELSAIAASRGFETYPRPLIWDRSPDGRLTTAEKWPRRCFECILYFRRGNRDLLEIRGDVLRYPADRDPGNYHGAKKPVELYADLLQRSTRAGDRFIDSFGGSGVALRAGKLTSREAWVVELEAKYLGLSESLLK